MTNLLGRAESCDMAATGSLRAFRHEGFWDCMDTYKDAVVLNDLLRRGAPKTRAHANGWQVHGRKAIDAPGNLDEGLGLQPLAGGPYSSRDHGPLSHASAL